MVHRTSSSLLCPANGQTGRPYSTKGSLTPLDAHFNVAYGGLTRESQVNYSSSTSMERLPQAPEGSETTPYHPHWALVERITTSHSFQSSLRLRKFLLYVASCALRDAPGEATEQQIGIHVFQRPSGYNSSEDNIVRTNARLLRQRLAEYFSGEGSLEEFILEIPKGHYVPVFRPRTPPEDPLALRPVSANVIEIAPARRARRAGRWLSVALVLLCFVAIAGALQWRHHRVRENAVGRFWAPFLTGPSLIIYSNALFVGDSASGMRYAPTGAGQNEALSGNIVDTYTGVGELTSVYDLTRLFDSRRSQFTLKRSQLVAWDEARTENLIFIGSVAENPSLRVLPNAMNFSLIAGVGWAGIANRQPNAGEQTLYSRPEHPLTRDYAILALLPGLQPGRKALIFSGLTTMGTQAAVEFACRPEGIQQILRVAGAADGSVRPFEAVLETTIGGGVPLETRLLAIHLR